MQDLTLEVSLQQRGISVLTHEDSEFSTYVNSFSGSHSDKTPRLITLPTTDEQVAAIVSECTSRGIPIAVRGGGHDVFGRFTHRDAVSIDLRRMSSVQVAADKKSANVSGGATTSQVLNVLNDHGLQVPVGSCGRVGFAGWSLVGGLGPYFQSYGLGADQITGAKVVNAQGNIIQADEELLKGLRGGGGSLGIVVELTIKVYPLQKIQAGHLLFDSTDIEKAVTLFLTGYESMLESNGGKLPSQLSILPCILAIPGLGVALTCGIVWNGAACDESRLWISRIASLAPILAQSSEPNALAPETSPALLLEMQTSRIPKEVAGRTETISARRFSPAVIAAVAKQATKIPSTSVGGGLVMHILRSDSPSLSQDVPASVCAYRQPQVVIEILGIAADEAAASSATAWAKGAQQELSGLEDAMKQTYLPVTPPEAVDLEAIYRDKLAELILLKEQHDPLGVFTHTLPSVVR